MNVNMPLTDGADSPAPAASPADPVPPIRKAAILVVSLEQPLASKLLAELDRPAVEAVTLEIARLDRIDPDEQRQVLDEFFDLGLRRLWFAFDDVVKLDDRHLRSSYHDDDASVWALALAGAARPVRQKVLGALSANSSASLHEMMESLGPFRLDDAESAQAELAEHLRRLHDRGQLTLPEPAGREEVFV